MRGARLIARGVQRAILDNGGSSAQLPACQSAVSARSYSSAMLSCAHQQATLGASFVQNEQSGQQMRPQTLSQLTSLITPQFRNFSSDSSGNSEDTFEQTAALSPGFDPASVLSAVAGVEDDGWAAAREDVWFFNRYMQSTLRTAQELTGLPWWETIALTTLFFRTATIPLHVMSVKNTYNMSKARPEVEKLAAQLREEQGNNKPNAMSEYQRKLAGVWKRNDCHPVKSLVPILAQAPVFIGFFTSLQSLALAKVPSLMAGGAFWFNDLTTPDSTFLLPAMAFGVFLLTAELGGADGMQGQPPHVIQRFKWTMRVLTVVMVPFAMHLPSSVFIYWVTSNTWSFVQSMVLKMHAVKKYLGLPITTARPGSNPSVTAVQPLTHASGGRPIETFSSRPPAARQTGKRKQRR